MNIAEIAQIADSTVKTKPSKDKAFKTLATLIEHTDDENMKIELASLYKYFTPAIPKKPKTSFDWVSQAMAKKDVRYYLNYIYVEGDNLVATDGHRLHLSFEGGKHLADGYYDKAGTVLNGTDWARYPDYNRILCNTDDWAEVSVEDFYSNFVHDTSVMSVDTDGVKTHINKKYFAEMLAHPNGYPDGIFVRESHQIICKWPNGDRSVIMSVRAK